MTRWNQEHVLLLVLGLAFGLALFRGWMLGGTREGAAFVDDLSSSTRAAGSEEGNAPPPPPREVRQPVLVAAAEAEASDPGSFLTGRVTEHSGAPVGSARCQ